MDSIFNKTIEVPGQQENVHGTGWLPSMPDTRDYDEGHIEVTKILGKLNIPKKLSAPPSQMDLRQWCSPIEDQGSLGSCTANAAVGIVEYFENRGFSKYIEGSRLFVYKTTRNLMGVTGDTGAFIRTTMQSLTLCGVPDEKFWPYTDKTQPGTGQDRYFDLEPTAFVYALADNYEAVKYFRHDTIGKTPAQILESVKKWIVMYIPSMFGFYVFPSYTQSDVPGAFPYPSQGERAIGGHAVVAVGYDDGKKIKNLRNGKITTGAILIRNSWGTSWGDKGYGWLPYDYILNGLASDFWSLTSLKWIDTDQFGFPGSLAEAAEHETTSSKH